MRVTTVSVVADRGRNTEDFVGWVPTAAVVVDGAFVPGAEGVCRHGVAWCAHWLGSGLLALLGPGGDEPLPALLAGAMVLDAACDDEERDRVLAQVRAGPRDEPGRLRSG